MTTGEERIERAKIKAINYDMNYVGCSQSVLGALQGEFGIGNEESFKASTVLSGGIARQGETCGAVIGALSALGLVIGRSLIEDTEAYRSMMDPSTELRNEFMEEIKKQFKLSEDLENTLCSHIQERVLVRSFNMADENDYQSFLDAGGHSEFGCPKVCGIAAEIAAKKILELLQNG